ncbi:hypothetical protein [Xanthomonas citri phage CP2]|uniref:Rz-like spanin n=1 Tax=Xanthomonas citri phage CP2 TaxID=1188795 RepID=UPI00029B6393|nr:Rz-like spanin [Xanthomonas citri phage CP2]BAM66431.1 hypothetical protein [Xanthomonas citri phage CP2]
MRALLWLPSILLAACGRQAVKPDIPTTPAGVVEVPVEVYVPIDADLTARCQWRETAPLEVMPSVARERKKCLQFYEGNLDAIERVQGRPVPKLGQPFPAIKRKK